MIKEYSVKTLENLCWDDVPKAEILTYKWASGYEPRAYAQVAVLKGRGIAAKLTAHESEPLAEKKKFNDPVFEDSCLEFFAMFDPKSEKYINIEMNSVGAFLATVRKADGDIVTIDNFIDLPKIKVEKSDDKWSVEVFLSFSDINKMFPGATFESGSVIRANFYKCGDKTQIPHYGMWNEIGGDKISYHQPEYFGKLIIE
ncbi:MAG: carbohydrate-binding family 9-like protein [Clostridia bacterium]|nr:carbohydrate-binding family 9-like protein [Clostridia bacterium]